jgi:hypothetical protein
MDGSGATFPGLEVVFKIGISGSGGVDGRDSIGAQGGTAEIGMDDDASSINNRAKRWRDKGFKPLPGFSQQNSVHWYAALTVDNGGSSLIQNRTDALNCQWTAESSYEVSADGRIQEAVNTG